MVKNETRKACINCKHKDQCCYRGGYSDNDSLMSLYGLNPYIDHCFGFKYKEDKDAQ